jgi:hypothetical protein
MATPALTRNNRDSMVPATAATGLSIVTPRRSTWLDHEYPLRRSRCRWSSRTPLNYKGVDGNPNQSWPDYGNNGFNKCRTVFRIWPTAPAHETRGNPKRKPSASFDTFMFHYEVIGCLRESLLPVVAICCNTQKSADSASRSVRPISFIDEGANRDRWARIHRRIAERQVRAGSICARFYFYLSYRPPARGRSPLLGTKLRWLPRGMKLREVREAMKLDGLAIQYPQASVYGSWVRRRRRPSTSAPQTPPALINAERGCQTAAAQSIQKSAKATAEKEGCGFDYDPFSISKNRID